MQVLQTMPFSRRDMSIPGFGVPEPLPLPTRGLRESVLKTWTDSPRVPDSSAYQGANAVNKGKVTKVTKGTRVSRIPIPGVLDAPGVHSYVLLYMRQQPGPHFQNL